MSKKDIEILKKISGVIDFNSLQQVASLGTGVITNR
jgi:hypothetical protein